MTPFKSYKLDEAATTGILQVFKEDTKNDLAGPFNRILPIKQCFELLGNV
jgi:hypothetical protein